MRRFQVRDVGCVGQCFQTISLPGMGNPPGGVGGPILALTGFKLFFTGARDHELDRVGVWFRGSDLHVALRDKNGDDTFGYLVDFVAIPTTGLRVTSGIQRGQARGGTTISIPGVVRADFLLTGWAFNFVSDDHEIRDMGVLRNGNNVTMLYGDKNADDLFDWRVEWAQVGRQLIFPGGVLEATAQLQNVRREP